MIRSHAIYFVFLFFLLAVPSFSQMGTTALRGVVFDSFHAAIAGARVTLINPAQGQRRETAIPLSMPVSRATTTLP
jgi:hypothetical protein